MHSSAIVLLLAALASIGYGYTPTQRESLLSIFNTCHGTTWPKKFNGNWGTNDVCTWSGVTCDDKNEIVGIDIEGDTMLCQLPDSIGSLTELKVLDISGNLRGTIPSGIRQLSRLERLKLYQNQITGSLPDWVSELTELREIGIVPRAPSKGLTGTIPQSWSTLTKLEVLFLDSNSLSGTIPDWLEKVAPTKHLRGNAFIGPCPQPAWLPADKASINCGGPGGQQPRGGVGNRPSIQAANKGGASALVHHNPNDLQYRDAQGRPLSPEQQRQVHPADDQRLQQQQPNHY
eukprot:PhF_6_TR41696/c0_g1_i2/m.63251